MQQIKGRLLLSTLGLIVFLFNCAELNAAPKIKKNVRNNNQANVKITALNYVDGKNTAIPGAGFPISINLTSSDDYSALDGEAVAVGFYLVKPENASDITRQNIAANSLYFGQLSLNSPKKGFNNFQERIAVKEDLKNHSGSYFLYALIDPWNKKSENKSDNLYSTPFQVTISPESFNLPSIEIASLKPDTRAIILDKSTKQTINGLLSLEAGFADYDFAEVSFCMVEKDNSCRQLQVWDSGLKVYGQSYKIVSLKAGDETASLFEISIPDDLIDSLLPAITKPMGDTFILRAQVTAQPKIDGAPVVSDYSELRLNLLPPFEENPYLLTDYGQDVRDIVLKTRREVKIARQTGFINGKKGDKKNKNKKDNKDLENGIASLDESLRIITKELKAQADNITNTIGGTPAANLPGSRFNMPNLDFPWRRNLEVSVPPPPVRYSGDGFPTIAEYRRCIPYFCGAMNEKDIGREPSEACIRQYCGTTEQDIRYGGRNPNLVDIPAGFDYGFSHKGFGARIGLSGRVKVFKDPAIQLYVGGSYENSAFFGVTVFGYSVPIFEGFSQAVYSPREIKDSYSQSVLKVLGKVVEREEKTSESIQDTFGLTYGFKKGAEIGVGPFEVDVSAEAGGNLSIGFSIGAGVGGITGTVSPGASLGASARASAGIAGASVGIEGAIELVRNTLEAAVNLNVALDILKKSITPQISLTITNILTGPNGSIKVFVETIFDTFRVTLASFSTGEFRKVIYDKNTSFAEIKL